MYETKRAHEFEEKNPDSVYAYHRQVESSIGRRKIKKPYGANNKSCMKVKKRTIFILNSAEENIKKIDKDLFIYSNLL
jgi:hypothetical protein